MGFGTGVGLGGCGSRRGGGVLRQVVVPVIRRGLPLWRRLPLCRPLGRRGREGAAGLRLHGFGFAGSELSLGVAGTSLARGMASGSNARPHAFGSQTKMPSCARMHSRRPPATGADGPRHRGPGVGGPEPPDPCVCGSGRGGRGSEPPCGFCTMREKPPYS